MNAWEIKKMGMKKYIHSQINKKSNIYKQMTSL